MRKILGYFVCSIILILPFSVFLGIALSGIMNALFTENMDLIKSVEYYLFSWENGRIYMMLIMSFMFFMILTYVMYSLSPYKAKVGMQKITPLIHIPEPAGQNQYGSARFSTKRELSEEWKTVCIKKNNPTIKELLKLGGNDKKEIKLNTYSLPIAIQEPHQLWKQGEGLHTPLKYYKVLNREYIMGLSEDIHQIVIGSTRCGKTRCLVLQSIIMQALSGYNIIASDPKGELFDYTHPTLTRLGYSLYALDFKNPNKSIHYNFLQFVIDAINDGDISKATQACWDIVDSLVKENNTGEPIWTNGEKGTIAAAIMLVCYDNSPAGLKQIYPNMSDGLIQQLYENENKYYQNCTNLFTFVAEMCKPVSKTQTLLDIIIESLPDDHPAKLILMIAGSAPSRTRGSFITSVLGTLRLFTDPNIAAITRETTPGILNLDEKKAIFIILPDSKTTYYPLAALFVSQYYQYQSAFADELGGRLNRDTVYDLDEFGNFAKLPAIESMLTVGGGRGILFKMFIQEETQIALKYDEKISKIIFGDAHYWIYLKSTSNTTNEMIEKKLNKYTVLSPGTSTSFNNNSIFSQTASSTSSSSLTGRSLLMANELERIKRPYMLTIGTTNPAITKMPDISKWYFNKILGMGGKKHNTKLRMLRFSSRPDLEMDTDLRIWKFRDIYINQYEEANADYQGGIENLLGDNDQQHEEERENILEEMIKNLS